MRAQVDFWTSHVEARLRAAAAEARPRAGPALAAAQHLFAAQRGRFPAWLALAAIAGNLAYFTRRAEPPPALAAALLLAGAALAAARLPEAARYWSRPAGVLLLAAGFGVASAQLAGRLAPPQPALPATAVHLRGRVIASETLPDAQRLTLGAVTLNGQPLGPRWLRLRVATPSSAPPGTAPAIAPGATVALRARLMPPAPPAYPGGRDEQLEAYFTNLAGFGTALGPVVVEQPATATWLQRLRVTIAARVQEVLPGSRGAIAATLLTGLSGAIPPEDRAAFRDAGLSHLLAIAGLHIGIVMGLVLGATRFVLARIEPLALRLPIRHIAGLAALAAGFFYLLLTGLHVPTLRSFAMACLVTLGLLTGRRAISMRGWAYAVFAVLAVAPEAALGPSFQLSFAAVLALIAGYEALRGPLRRLKGEATLRRRVAHTLAGLALTSLLAGTACLPFIAYHFGQVQPYFVLANLLAVPLTAFWVMPAGLAALALMPAGLDRLALIPMGWGIRLILWLARAIAAWPGAAIATPHVTVPSLLAMAAGLAVLCLWRGRARALGILPVVAGLLLALTARPPDLLIAADARLAASRQGGVYRVLAARGGDRFVQNAWQVWTGLPTMACAPGAPCQAGPILLAPPPSGCNAAVAVSLTAAVPPCGTLAIGRALVARQGAVALWLGHPPRLVTDADIRGRRPWVAEPAHPRPPPALPLAARDALPPEPEFPGLRD